MDSDQKGVKRWQDLVTYNRVAIEVSCKHLERKIIFDRQFWLAKVLSVKDLYNWKDQFDVYLAKFALLKVLRLV